MPAGHWNWTEETAWHLNYWSSILKRLNSQVEAAGTDPRVKLKSTGSGPTTKGLPFQENLKAKRVVSPVIPSRLYPETTRLSSNFYCLIFSKILKLFSIAFQVEILL